MNKHSKATIFFGIVCIAILVIWLCGCGDNKAASHDKETEFIVRLDDGQSWNVKYISSMDWERCGVFKDRNGMESYVCPGYTVREYEVLP